MVELRWVVFGPNRQLEYRTKTVVVDNWGSPLRVGEWSDWKIVPSVDGDEAAYEDVRATGGIVSAP
jgi:hypothetical protein